MLSRVEPGLLPATIEVPGSKSHANRYLILAALWGDREVAALPSSQDVVAMVEALRAVGVGLEISGDVVRVTAPFPACESSEAGPLVVEVGEGGTTARFLTAMLATGRRRYVLRLAGRLAQRPWEELLAALRESGAHAVLEGDSVVVQGPVDWKRLPSSVDAGRSTQFASALQLAGAREGVTLTPMSMTGSQAYWQLTLAACEEVARAPRVVVPRDWSSASYPLALAAVTNQRTFLPGLQRDGLQADAFFGEWLEARGALRFGPEGVHAQALTDRRPCRLDLSPCPDLTPAMAFVCAHLEGDSLLSGLGALVHKESDRLSEIKRLLRACGVEVRSDDGTLSIRGGTAGGPWSLQPPADHRMVMMAALLLAAHGGGDLTHADAVEKSFPDFFRIMGLQK